MLEVTREASDTFSIRHQALQHLFEIIELGLGHHLDTGCFLFEEAFAKQFH